MVSYNDGQTAGSFFKKAFQTSTLTGAAHGNGTYKGEINWLYVFAGDQWKPFNYQETGENVVIAHAGLRSGSIDFRMFISIPDIIILNNWQLFQTHAIKKFKLYAASDINTPTSGILVEETNNPDTTTTWKTWTINNPTVSSSGYLMIVPYADGWNTTKTYLQTFEIRLSGTN